MATSDANLPPDPGSPDVEASHLSAVEVYEQAPLGILTLDPKGLVRGLNGAAAAMMETDRQHALGRPLVGLLSLESASLVLKHLKACAGDGGRVSTLETTVRLQSGQRRRWLLMSRALLGADGPRCVTALTDVTERRQVDEGLTLLNDLAAALLDTLDPTVVLERLGRALVPALADLCVVDLIEGHALKRRAHLVHADPERGARYEEAEARWGPLPNVSFATLQALQARGSHLLPEVTPDYLQAAAVDGEHLAALVGQALRTWCVVPLVASDDAPPLGAVRLASSGVRRALAAEDLRLAERAARLAGAALRNARLHRAALAAAAHTDERGRALARDLDGVARALLKARSGLEGRSPRPAPQDLGAAAERVRGIVADLERRAPGA